MSPIVFVANIDDAAHLVFDIVPLTALDRSNIDDIVNLAGTLCDCVLRLLNRQADLLLDILADDFGDVKQVRVFPNDVLAHRVNELDTILVTVQPRVDVHKQGATKLLLVLKLHALESTS